MHVRYQLACIGIYEYNSTFTNIYLGLLTFIPTIHLYIYSHGNICKYAQLHVDRFSYLFICMYTYTVRIILPLKSCVHTTTWMHHMDSNKTH